MNTGLDSPVSNVPTDGVHPSQKLDLFYASLGILDRDKFWKQATFLEKAKVVFFMLAFNFIFVYKFCFGKPLISRNARVKLIIQRKELLRQKLAQKQSTATLCHQP